MKVNLKIIGLLSIAIMFGGIAIFMGLGLWQTESTKTPAKYSTGIYAGTANPADIRGSYTFAEVADAFEISDDVLKEAFLISLDVDSDQIQTKDLEEMYNFEEGIEIGNGSVKLFVALYKGLPYTLGDDYLFDKAVDLIKAMQTDLSPEVEHYLSEHTVISKDLKALYDENENVSNNDTTGEVETLNETDDEMAENTLIKGNTTFQQVIDWGVTPEAIEAILKSDLPQRSMTVKDYCVDRGLEFSEIKTALQDAIE